MTDSLLQTLAGTPGYDPDSLSVERARALILSLLPQARGRERVFLRDGLDRVLAEDVISPIDVPAHDNSAMDGFALRHTDLDPAGPTRLRIVGTAFAGRPYDGKVDAGETVRIMTGATLPAGIDTVAVQEVCQVEGDTVLIPAGQTKGQNIRYAGEDLTRDKPALRAGQRLRPAELGILASLGIAEVTVRPRLRVALFSTGDELASIGEPLQAGQIYDSNRYTLWGMLRRLGCEVLDMGVVRDDPAALEAALSDAAANADAIITSGGVSVGEADFIKDTMARLGEVAFWKIAMKPGRPMAFGRIGRGAESAFLFGLPGNPVAVMVTFYQFVRPALQRMAGMPVEEAFPAFPARCSEAMKKGKGRTEFQRGVLFREDGVWCVRPVGAQGSGVLRSMSEADCFIVLAPDQGHVAAGDTVLVQPMTGLV